MRATLALFVVLALSASRIGSAQTAPQPTRLENVQYYKVEYHRFKPGKADEGRAFIRKYYRPADRAAGIQVLEFTPVTGDWDWIAFFPVEHDFLVWQRPAMSLRARAKFEQMAGGADEATKLDKEFDNLVQEVRIEIMMRDVEK